MKRYRNTILSALSLLVACSGSHTGAASAQTEAKAPEHTIQVPTFDADSAYAYIKAQTDMGPRVPGTPASARCAEWLAQQLRDAGASDVVVQQARLQAYNGDAFDARNISARFNPGASRHVMLLSHWDSRPWADRDPDPANHRSPIDGANDGASGVGVILEIARHLAKTQPGIGVDVLLVDAEDYGTHAADEPDTESSWCLGTQYWVQHPTIDPATIDHAILLDMVGGKDAVFAIEPYSMQNAQSVVKRLWSTARDGGSGRFVDALSVPIIDDHVYLIAAGIPAVDIIEAAHPSTGSFNPNWHTKADNIANIDKNTLKAVGQTLLDYLYNLQ